MDINFNIGDRLIVELEDECYVGDLNHINKDRNRIELINVSDFDTHEQLSGGQIFYKADILSIKLVKANYVETSTSINSDASSCSISETENPSTTQLTFYELENIEKISKSAQYISKTDRFYHNAITDIRCQTEIVLNVEGSQVGRCTRTSIVTMATRQNIYIFDILSLGRVFPELKEILEANWPKKIIHDSRKVVDNLKYQQDVEIKGIFDTYAAHVGCGGDKSIWDLGDCIKKYLNMPASFLLGNKNINWQMRPLDEDRKIMTCKKALFTFKIYDCLLHEYILKNIYKQFDTFANVYSNNKDSVEVASDIASHKNSSVDDIEYFDLDLAASVEEID